MSEEYMEKNPIQVADRLFGAVELLADRGELGLMEIAQARLANPELDLKSLGETLDPPIGKSGVNHRLRRLIQIADGLSDTKGR